MKQYALITGASGGIGECLAYEIGREGYSLILVGRNVAKLESVVERVKTQYGVEVISLVVDLANRESREQFVKQIEAMNIQFSIFVNNAGIGHYGPFMQCDSQKDEETIALNIEAFTHLTKVFKAHMTKEAYVLQVASTAAFAPGPYMAVYYASKAYVVSLSLALRKEWVGSGVSVSVLCPGPTQTAFQSRAQMEKTGLAKHLAMTPEVVATCAYKGMKKGKALIIPGVSNKIAAKAMELLPLRVGAVLVNQTQKK